MKAIRTKYKGPTNTRGSRIIASDEDGNKVTISYPYELSGEAVHRKAAEALCKKMDWRCAESLAGGSVKNGYVFVFTGHSWPSCCAAARRLADLVCAMYHPKDDKARQTWPTATWAEIIACELGIQLPQVAEGDGVDCLFVCHKALNPKLDRSNGRWCGFWHFNHFLGFGRRAKFGDVRIGVFWSSIDAESAFIPRARFHFVYFFDAVDAAVRSWMFSSLRVFFSVFFMFRPRV
jgi:hypothetical protein